MGILNKGKFLIILFIGLLGSGNVIATNTTEADDLYKTRMAALKSTIDLAYHPSAKPFIEEYLSNPEKVRELIGRSKYYFPLIERALRSKGLPSDLKYLAATASMLDPSAVSINGASGIWMMTFPVSKMYKLKVNTYVDERRDPIKSSNVASQHFRDLYSIYKSWPLAIASYGCSPVTLNKCIHNSNNSLYFWDIYPHMPTFCKDLYSRVIATAYILNYYKEHGIKTAEPKFEVVFDTVMVNKWLSLQQISSVTGSTLEELRELNPIFRKDIIPFSLEGYYLKIPRSKAANFYLLKDTVYRPLNPIEIQPSTIQKADEALIDSINGKGVASAGAGKSKAELKAKEPTGFSKRKVTYIVKKGDNLGDIADWFDVTQAEIKSWNKLKKNKVNAKQKLIIWVEGNKTGYYKKINKMNASQKKKLKRKD
ncbi:MAG: transglycosylase SLT domain-containing protein [Bacteroidota bacterium]|nr:transglycosylase SLT domain-containing protein [Bacteroidota bacterium]